MAWQFLLYLLILILTVLMSLRMAVAGWRRRTAPGALPFALLMLMVAWWAGLRALEGATSHDDLKLTFGKLAYFGIVNIAPLWLAAALSYCGFESGLTRRNLIWLWVIPVVTLVLVLTNDWHGWVWRGVTPASELSGWNLTYHRGWWWYLAIVYYYVLLVTGALLLVRQAVRGGRELRHQVLLLVIAVAIPWFANILNLLRIYPVPGLDLTPFALAVAGVIMAVGIFRFQLFDLTPLVHSAIIDDLQDAILVIDDQGRILDMNRMALQLTGLTQAPIGQPLDRVLAPWSKQLERYRDVYEADEELVFSQVQGEPRYLEMRIMPLRDRRAQIMGRIITARDVTDRHQAEVQLRQLQRAVEHSPASVVITDTAGHIEYVNPHFTQLTGYTLEEVLGRNPNILKTDHTPPEAYARMWQAIVAGREWHGEFLNRKKNGELYWEDAHIGPVTDADGRVTHYVAVKEDITARKRTEEELQQGRARLKAIFDNASVGITLTDRTGRYIQVNQRWSEMIGYPLEALYQLGPLELTYPADRAANETKLRELVAGTIDAYELEKRYVRQDGSVFWGVLSVTPIRNAAGEFEASLGIVSDITERKAAETNLQERAAELHGVIDTSRDGILMIALDARLSVINAVALRLLNLTGRPEDWRGRSVIALLYALRRAAPEAARAGITELHQLRQVTDQRAHQREVEVLGHTLLWQTLPVRAGDRLLGWLLALRDLTDDRALEQLREDLRHTLVHDLRNPLTSIATSVDVLVDEPELLQPHQLQLLQIAQRNSQRMINMVNQILDVSRLESGQLPLSLRTWSLPELIIDALQAQQALAHDKDITLESRVPIDLPLVHADEDLIRRVLQNLVGNAVKFTPPGGCVTLMAEFTALSSAQPSVLVSVHDTGPGIPPEIQAQLFQKFVTGSQKGRGSGLGLAFCKLVVEAHQQQIWVDSLPGQGAVFTFTLAAADGLA
ncbi:two-component system, NarL family, sensor histidine kinase EvgS [Thermoflexales bacterium]|nr:two-component system, NarL family, sensor histidine kinase EvgS [Thermoflexales bacterium]